MGEVQFETRPDGRGFRVVDPASGEQYGVRTPGPVDPVPCAVDLPVPVATTARFTTSALTVETSVMAYVRRADGTMEEPLRFGERATRDAGARILEFSTPIKTYLRVEGPFELDVTDAAVDLRFPGEHEVVVGVRSYRRRPTATVTTTDDPADVARVLSLSGASMQTFSPERSFPTLRDHPPAIRLGEELRVPDGLSPPDTGVVVEVPYTFESLYAVAPLAFYLGASVVAGDEPRLRLETGASVSLADPDLVTACERLLERCVLLDCLTRLEGLYPYDLRERAHLERDLSLPWGDLYDAPLAERTERYLDVEYDTLAPYVPRWPAVAFVEPTAPAVESVPHLLDQLLPIRPCRPDRVSGPAARSRALARFTNADAGPTRSASAVFRGDRTFAEVPPSGDRAALWCGEDIPLGANHLLAAGVENYHGRRPAEQSDITVTLVCNDATMRPELDDTESVYGSRERVPFEVDSYRRLETDELAALLAEPRDFLHFIGHASEEGLHCPDGILAPDSVDSVGVKTFFLNACSSYTPGVAFVEGGAIGGVVTLSDINEESAKDVGVLVARLLDSGFSLRTALQIARQRSVVGGQYVCVGMDSVSLTHPEGGVVYSCTLARDDGLVFDATSYPTRHWDVGSVATFGIDESGQSLLAGNPLGPRAVDAEALAEFFGAESVPVRVDGEWRWSDDLLDELGHTSRGT